MGCYNRTLEMTERCYDQLGRLTVMEQLKLSTNMTLFPIFENQSKRIAASFIYLVRVKVFFV